MRTSGRGRTTAYRCFLLVVLKAAAKPFVQLREEGMSIADLYKKQREQSTPRSRNYLHEYQRHGLAAHHRATLLFFQLERNASVRDRGCTSQSSYFACRSFIHDQWGNSRESLVRLKRARDNARGRAHLWEGASHDLRCEAIFVSVVGFLLYV